jgi:hypothetical protein
MMDITITPKTLEMNVAVSEPDVWPLTDPDKERMKTKIAAALENIKNGMPIYKACAAANVSNGYFYKWMNLAPENKQAVYAILDERVFTVEDALYNSALKGEFKAQVFFLTNRAPERWKHTSGIIANLYNNTQNNTVNIESNDEIRSHTERIRNELERYLSG